MVKSKMEGHRIMEDIERAFKEKVSDHIKIMSEGEHRYRVFTPFMFADGDHFSIILKREDGGWMLSDEGHTLMHLSFGRNEIDSATQRGGAITNALTKLGVLEIPREFIIRIVDERYGDALYNLVQSLLKVASVFAGFRDHEEIDRKNFSCLRGMREK